MRKHPSAGVISGGVRLVRYLAALITAILLLVGLTPSPVAAQDVEENNDPAPAGKPITISKIHVHSKEYPEDMIIRWEKVVVNIDWEAEDGVGPKQTFTVALPPELRFFEDEDFGLTDNEGEVGGTCHVSVQDRHVSCTVDERFSKKFEVKGTIQLEAQAKDPRDEKNLRFEHVGVGEIIATVPSGGSHGIFPEVRHAPNRLEKWGWYEHSAEPKVAEWVIHIGGDVVKDGGNNPVVITDELGGFPHTYVEDSFVGKIFEVAEADNGRGSTSRVRVTRDDDAELLNLSKAIDGNKATITLTAPAGGWDGSKHYIVFYKTRADRLAPLTERTTNNANLEINGKTVSSDTYVVRQQHGSGTVTGVDRASVEIEKVLADGSATLPEGTTFRVQAEYEVKGKREQEILELQAHGAAVSGQKKLPRGTKVTLSEIELPELQGITFGDPRFMPKVEGDPNVEIKDGGKQAVVTIKEDSNVQLILENSATVGSGEFGVAKSSNHKDANRKYTFHYECTVGDQKKTGTIENVTGNATPVMASEQFPVGTQCTITEDRDTANDPAMNLVIEPENAGNGSQVITVGEQGKNIATFRNVYSQKQATFSLRKIINDPEVKELAVHKEFSFHYACDKTAGVIKVKGDGNPVVVEKTFPVGTECLIKEDPASADIPGFDLTTANLEQRIRLLDEENSIFEASFENTYVPQTGKFKVTKTVRHDGIPAAEQRSFDFSYTCTKEGAPEITGTITDVRAGQSKEVASEIPAGYQCIVTEESGDTDIPNTSLTKDYGSAAVIERQGMSEIQVVNLYTKELADFTITKTVTDPDGVAAGKEFWFDYVCAPPADRAGEAPVSGEIGPVTAGQSVTSAKVPAGYSCKVTERDAAVPDADLATLGLNSAVEIKANDKNPVTVENKYSGWKGTLNVSKAVSGTAKEFEALKNHKFEANFKCVKGGKVTKEGKIELSAGNTTKVEGVLANSECTIAEDIQKAEVPGLQFIAGESTTEVIAPKIHSNGGNAEVQLRNVYSELGKFKVTKTLAGLTGDLAGKDRDFEIEASWTIDGKDESKIFTIRANQVVEDFPALPIGTKVLLKETRPQDNAVGHWVTPGFDSEVKGAVEDHRDGSATLTIQSNTYSSPLLVTITNTANPPWWWLLVPLVPFVGGNGGSSSGPSGLANNAPGQNAAATGATAQHATTTADANVGKQQTLARTGASVIGVVAVASLVLCAGVYLVRRART